MADDLVDHFYEVDDFMERCLKFKREMEAVMAPCKDVYKDVQNKAKQPKITFFTKSSVSPSAMHFVYFHHPNNFQPGTPTSYQQTPTLMFSYHQSLIIHIKYHVLYVFGCSPDPVFPIRS
jgi:hypothetical protein